MHLARGLRKVGALLARGPSVPLEVDEAERVFRHIFRYLKAGSDKRNLPKRDRPNVLVLQMAKVASTSIQAALRAQGVNAFHSHGLSSEAQHGTLAQLLERELTIPLVGGDLRRHILNVGLQLMARWYQRRKQYRGRKLKVITLTRDPVTHYPSAFTQRQKLVLPAILAWQRHRLGLAAGEPVDEGRAIADFFLELGSIIAEARISKGGAAYEACLLQARKRWPEHQVVGNEIGAWLGALSWFDREITPFFGLDMLADPGFAQRGWAEQGNDWADILVLKFESLAALVPEMQRFLSLPELALPRANVTSAKRGAHEVRDAMQAMLDTEIGRACARELRSTPYGRACGYEKLIER